MRQEPKTKTDVEHHNDNSIKTWSACLHSIEKRYPISYKHIYPFAKISSNFSRYVSSEVTTTIIS